MFVREAWVVGYMRKNAPNVNLMFHLCQLIKTNALYFWTNLYVTNSSKHPDIAKDFLMFVLMDQSLRNLRILCMKKLVGYLHEMMLLPAILMFMKEFPNIKVLQLSQKIMNCIHIQESMLRTKHSPKLVERLVKIYQNEFR